MKAIITFLILNHVLFPKTRINRIIVHIFFWLLFITGHVLFFLPDMLRGTAGISQAYTYILYYGKFLFIFYTCLILFRILRRNLGAFYALPLMFLVCILVTYMFNMCVFKIAAALIGLENTTVNFEMLATIFLTGIHRDWISRLSLVIFNLQDMQLLILPVGVKMVKFGMSYQRQLQDSETQRVKSELHRLRYQLGPHFTLNILSSLYVQLKKINAGTADYLGKLTDLIYYSLYEIKEDMISLEREIHYFKTLIDLESGRQHSRMMLSIEQTGTITSEHRIPSLMLMTLAENAFKHGGRSDTAPSFLNVSIAIKNNKMDFLIENSKTETKQINSNKPSGIGLRNIVQRLELYFHNNFTFKTHDSGGMFSVKLVIPLNGKELIKAYDT